MALVQAQPVIHQTAGPHAVGFRVQPLQDASRSFRPSDAGPDGPRPVQTLIWYPAVGGGQPLRYADYVATRVTEQRLDLPAAELATRAEALQSRMVQRLGPSARATLDSPMRAHRQAEPAPGPFPLLVYAAGAGGVADENADLCEYLASHGFVVLAITSLGARGKDIGDTLDSVTPQLADIRLLIDQAPQLARTDAQRVAVMGWSWGGMVNLFAAERDARIGALVSLDGTREPELTRLIDVRRLTAPWLYVSRSPDTIAQLNRSGIDTRFSLLNAAVHAEVTQLIMYPLQHADMVSRRLHEAAPTAYDEYSRDEVQQAFNMVALYVRRFLEATLKQDTEAQAFLRRRPRDNGAAPHAMRIEHRPAQAAARPAP